MKLLIFGIAGYALAGLVWLTFIGNGAFALEYTVQQYSSGQYLGMELADMDGDGAPELLAGSWLGNHVEIWKYDQSTNRLVLVDDIPGFPGNTISVKARDFDKDGDKDVAVGLRGAGLWYATNNGLGGWNLTQIDPTYSWHVLVSDFDQDGNLDIFDGADQNPFIRLFYGDGTGGFTNPGRNFPPTPAPRGFNVVDINGNGKPDLIGTGAFDLRAFLNPGGRMTDWQSIGPATPIAMSGVDELVTNLSPSAADLDGNGVVDQVGYLHNFSANNREVIVFDGSVVGGSYSWTKRVIGTFAATAGFGATGLADLNDDGHLDIFVGSAGPTSVNGIMVYLGDSLGNFTQETVLDRDLGGPFDHGVGGQETIVTLDINGDGATDIIAARSVNGQGDGFELLLASQPDADNDGVPDDDDNCPMNANSNQTDTDSDGEGDACDDDDDGDGVLDVSDNCPLAVNSSQEDFDEDGAGDRCDTDDDNDGVLDADDLCLYTSAASVTNATGCSIADLCPCIHPDGLAKWKNHGKYVSCVAHAANDFRDGGLISDSEHNYIVSEAGQSNCGSK